MRFILIVVLLVFTCTSMAQKRILVDFKLSLLNSIGSDASKDYESEINPYSFGYYTKKKLKHPSINLIAGLAYPFSKKLSVGIQSGFYLRFKEEYYTLVQRTSMMPTLQLTAKYKLFTIDDRWLGVNVAAGMLFFDFTDVLRFHNSILYNACLSYQLTSKSSIQIGIENEADRVSIDLKKFNQNLFKSDVLKYNINRLFFNASYSFVISK